MYTKLTALILSFCFLISLSATSAINGNANSLKRSRDDQPVEANKKTLESRIREAIIHPIFDLSEFSDLDEFFAISRRLLKDARSRYAMHHTLLSIATDEKHAVATRKNALNVLWSSHVIAPVTRTYQDKLAVVAAHGQIGPTLPSQSLWLNEIITFLLELSLVPEFENACFDALSKIATMHTLRNLSSDDPFEPTFMATISSMSYSEFSQRLNEAKMFSTHEGWKTFKGKFLRYAVFSLKHSWEKVRSVAESLINLSWPIDSVKMIFISIDDLLLGDDSDSLLSTCKHLIDERLPIRPAVHRLFDALRRLPASGRTTCLTRAIEWLPADYELDQLTSMLSWMRPSSNETIEEALASLHHALNLANKERAFNASDFLQLAWAIGDVKSIDREAVVTHALRLLPKDFSGPEFRDVVHDLKFEAPENLSEVVDARIKVLELIREKFPLTREEHLKLVSGYEGAGDEPIAPRIYLKTIKTDLYLMGDNFVFGGLDRLFKVLTLEDDEGINGITELLMAEEFSTECPLHVIGLERLIGNYWKTYLRFPAIKGKTLAALLSALSSDNENLALLASNHVLETFPELGLTEESPLTQMAERVGLLLDSSDDPKNPYHVHRQLLAKREQPVDFDRVKDVRYVKDPNNVLARDYRVGLNPDYFYKLSAMKINPALVPTVDDNILDTMLAALEKRVQEHPALREAITSITGVSLQGLKARVLLGGRYLPNLLKASGQHKPTAQLKCVLTHIKSLLNTDGSDVTLSTQESAFLQNLISISECSVGQDGGIAECYAQLPHSFKLVTASGLRLEQNNLAIASKTHTEAFLTSTLQDLIEGMFSGTNALMMEICAEQEIEEAVHQGLYLRNLIGDVVGSNSPVKFDIHAQLYYEALLALSRQEALELFYKHANNGIAEAISHVQIKINEAINKPSGRALYNEIADLLGPNALMLTDDDEINVTFDGVLKLLIQFGAVLNDERLIH